MRPPLALVRAVTVLAVLTLAAAACGEASPPSPGEGSPAAASPTTVAPPDPTAARPAPDSPDAGELAAGLNDAGARLFLAIAEDAEDDVVLSPFSIGTAFGMADVGATGPAAEDLAELFAFPVDGQARLSAFNTLLLEVATEPGGDQAGDEEEGPVVVLANRQFPDESFTPEPAFTEAIATWFGAAAQPLPLQQDPDGSRDVINDYVADRTQDLIPELLPQGFITPQSVLVLVNALYLEADWATPFGKYPTSDADFTRLDGSVTTVPLMNDKELHGPAVAGDGYVAAERPYDGGELSMLVVVPDEGRFTDVRARLGEGLLAEIDATATEQSVDLYLPRFTSATTADLRALIQDQLGLDAIFSGHYEDIAEGIALTGAVHAADIEVDEIGTVAAAATGLGFEESGAGEADLTVRADRPFLYAIQHAPTGAVLFLGQVLDPSS